MADDKTPTEGTRRPDNLATFQGYVQGTPEIKKSGAGKEYAKLRMRVPNSQKDADGNWKNDVPSTFVDVAVFNPGQVADMKKAIQEGSLKKDAHFGIEGYPSKSTYEKDGVTRESWSVTPRGGKSAWSTEKPEAGKGLANEVNIRGVVGKMEKIEGVSSSTGKPYAFIKMDIAHKDDPDWKAKKDKTFTGEDRTKTTWFEVTIATPKNVEAVSKMMDEGKVGKGAVVSANAAMVPDKWTDKEGRERETMKFDMKPFANSLEVIRAPNASEKTKEQTADKTADKPAAEGGEKPKAKRAKKRKDDDEIPF